MNFLDSATLSPVLFPQKGSKKKKVIFLKILLAFSEYFCYYISCACEKAWNTQQQGGATDG